MTDVEGYYIYRSDWIEILDSLNEIGRVLKQKIFVNYLMKIRCKLELAKRRFI